MENRISVVASRRDLLKAALLLPAIAELLAFKGCSANQVFTDIENWVPVAEASVNSVVQILSANGFPIGAASQAIVTTIEAALNQLLADVKLYQSVNPPPVGALQKIQAALGIISSNYQQFLATLSISNSALVSTIVAIAQVVISTVQAWQNQLPATSSVTLSAALSVGGTAFSVAPKHRTRRQFKKDFNSVLEAAKGSKLTVPDGAFLKLSLLEHL